MAMDVFRFGKIMAKLNAAFRSQAVIEFDLSGNVVWANENFLATIGYGLSEIVGRHHSMFVDETDRGAGYDAFWAALRAGEYQAAVFKRIAKDKREIWLQASYNPLIGRNGKPYGVIKFATDVTRQEVKRADADGKLSALDRAQGIIEFDVGGTVLAANANFLAVVGYGLGEIVGSITACSCPRRSGTAATTNYSGRPCGPAGSRPPSTAASPGTATTSTCRRATIRSSTPPAGW